MCAFGPRTKYRRCLSKCSNKGKNGCKSAGKIGKILGKILYNSELITRTAAIVIAEEGRGLILHSEGQNVTAANIQSGML